MKKKRKNILLDCVGLFIRGGVLEDTFGSPWARRSSPWPWPRSLKSSKIALSSDRGQHYFLNCLNFVNRLKSFLENFFSGDRLENFFEDLFIFLFLFFEIAWKKFLKTFLFWIALALVSMVLGLGLEHSCPWPQEGLSSEGLSLTRPRIFFVSLASSLGSSTPSLLFISLLPDYANYWMIYIGFLVLTTSCLEESAPA